MMGMLRGGCDNAAGVLSGQPSSRSVRPRSRRIIGSRRTSAGGDDRRRRPPLAADRATQGSSETCPWPLEHWARLLRKTVATCLEAPQSAVAPSVSG